MSVNYLSKSMRVEQCNGLRPRRWYSNGFREVLSIVYHFTEGAICQKDELEALKDRGVVEIELVVSDAFQGIEEAVCAAFPCATHQFCVAHVKRQILRQCITKGQAFGSRGSL